jgi:hypothetical protein
MNQQGDACWEDLRRLRGLLNDLCQGCDHEIGVLLQAHERRIPHILRADAVASPLDLTVRRLVRRLQEAFMVETAAQWAVETWAAALGLTGTGAGPNVPAGASLDVGEGATGDIRIKPRAPASRSLIRIRRRSPRQLGESS